MSSARQAWIASLCIVLFGAIMGLFHFLATGINDQFGWGFCVGGLMGIGLTFLASRQARETP